MPNTVSVICSALNPAKGVPNSEGNIYLYICRKSKREGALENTKRNARLMPLNSFYIFCPGLCSLAWPETQRHADLTGLPPILPRIETPTTVRCFKTQRPCSIAGKCKSH